MNLLLRSQLRFLAHAPWSALTGLLGVTLGVASVVAVHLIGARVVESLEATTPPHLSGLSHVLEKPDAGADDYFELRERWRRQRASPVRALVPLVEGRAVRGEGRVLVLGADWLAMPGGASSAADEAPSGADEVSSAWAFAVSPDVLVGEAVLADRRLGLEAGDAITVGGDRYRVAEVGDTGLGDALLADIAAAQHMLGLGPQAVHRVGVALDDPWQSWRRRLDRLMPGFSAGLPAPALPELGWLAGWRPVPVEAQRPGAEFARSVLFNLGALGTLALLVAWFLVYQVGVVWLRRQHLVLQRLHAVGVPVPALRRSFVGVFAALGAAASVLGIGAGLVLADLLTGLTTAGMTVDPSAPARRGIDGWLLAKALGSGFGVCLLGGLGAFNREWRPRLVPAPLAISAAAALAVLAVVGIVLEGTGVLGGFLAIFAMSLAVLVLVAPALGLLRRVVLRLRGPLPARLALRDVAWYPRLLGVALAALSLAVATGIGIALMVGSFRLDFERMLAVRLAGDLYVQAAAAQAGEMARWLEDQPETAGVVGYGRERVRVDGVPVELGYARFDAAESARYGHPRALAPGEALISERLARDLGAGPGDELAAPRDSLTVAGVFAGFGDPLGRVLVDVASLDRLELMPRVDRLTITVHEGASERLAERFRARFPRATIESRAALRAEVLEIFDRTFAITHALTLLALVVATVGTYNALTGLRLQQAPVTALLRAQGVSAAALRGVALLRAATVGGIAAMLALPLGLAMAWTLCTVVNPRSFGWTIDLHPLWSGWLPPLLLGLLAALIAGALPAPRERGALHEAG